MADQDLTHTADIIKAAIPFVDSPLKGTAELFAKFLDLMGSLKSGSVTGKLAASGFRTSKIDLEGLLKGIRPICRDKEREMVDTFLNFFNMKRAFEMYNNMMSMMKSMQEYGDVSFADGMNDTDNVTNNFNASAFESIFKTFGSNFTDNNFSNMFSGNSSGDDNSEVFHTEEQDSSESEEPSGVNEQTETSNSGEETNSENNPGNSTTAPGGMNNMMFEMLKTMVPPEQKSTFENLSMLFNSMSYDNNSKSDDNKEQNDA